MNDYNKGALPDPCLRLDYGFGEQWASVELGDGTGYVRLVDYEKAVAENAKLRRASERDADVMESLNLSLEEAQAENDKLREMVDGLTWCCEHYSCRQECPLYDVSEPDHCREVSIKRELGIEVEDD